MITKLIGTGLFSGYVPVAPGTAGSLLCCILLFFLPEVHILYKILVLVMLFFTGAVISARLEREWGKDASKIVIDEITGMYCTMIVAPNTLLFLGAGFLFFRFFDIVKPFPVRLGEKLKEGWGIMADDIFAGIYAALVLRLFTLLVDFLNFSL